MFKPLLTLTAIAIGVPAAAQFSPPRGPDVGAQASSCNIGPFPQVSKAGEYNVLCDTMPDAEKCLALVKRHMSEDGVLRKAGEQDIEKVRYCLKTFENDLLSSTGE